jgi:dTDP-4-amino-4,6-dideoxygalactose transaminase
MSDDMVLGRSRPGAVPQKRTRVERGHDEPVRRPEDFLVFGSPLIGESEIAEVVDSLRTSWLGTGPKVARFEEAFRRQHGAPYVAAVNSCTAALHLALLAAGVGPGDEVVTTPLTFAATANAILHCGAVPVLADIDPRTMNLDVDAVAAAVSPRTRAVMPVHFAGRPCDMDALLPLARRHGLLVIEDCAHAVEAEYRGRRAGSFGDAGCFSFYVTKNLTTGEGGMVVSPHEELIQDVKVRALHGLSKDAWRRFSDEGYRHYQVVAAGFKYNMMDLQAAIGLHQLEALERNWHRRRAVWDAYDEALADLPLTLPASPEPGTRHAHHLYTVLVDEERSGIGRDAFLDAMTRQGIGVGVHYLSLPEHPFYRETLSWRPEDVPHAARVGRQTVSLPLSAKLTDRDVADVVEAVRRVLDESRPGQPARA